MQIRNLLITGIFSTLLQLPHSSYADSESISLDFSSDLSSREISAVLEIAKKEKAGKVISIIQQTEHSEKTYRVKVISNTGRLQTYSINQSITQMKP